jgi:hypothetical protein
MQTRGMKINKIVEFKYELPKQEYELPKQENGINFDESSFEWRKNKIYIGNGQFRYKKTKVVFDKFEEEKVE